MSQTHQNNREYGVGTVAEGTAEATINGYYADISSTVGHRFMSELNWVIMEGEPVTLRIGETANLAGMDFKISPDKLELRNSQI